MASNLEIGSWAIRRMNGGDFYQGIGLHGAVLLTDSVTAAKQWATKNKAEAMALAVCKKVGIAFDVYGVPLWAYTV